MRSRASVVPLEIPSEEEIKKNAFDYGIPFSHTVFSPEKSFEAGAKYIINKITTNK